MGADEEGMLERLKALRSELVDPKIAAHHGRRIVKTTGDGILIEFPSVVDAVRCAVEVQRAMPERNADAAPDNRIELCIGINPGEVIVEGDDLYGDPSTSPRRSKLWPTPAGCSSPIRFTKMFATGCPLFSRIWRAAAQKHCPRVERPAGATF
jgi:adenylate cyclase